MPCGTISIAFLADALPASVTPDVTCTHLSETTDAAWQSAVVAAIQPAAEALNSAAAAATPDLFIHNGIELGSLYQYPDFPAFIGLDNADSISGLQWSKTSQNSAKATGILNADSCKPDCASGSYVNYPIQLLVSDPQQCTVSVHKPYSYVSQQENVLVFSKIYVNVLEGHPPADLAGNTPVLPLACGSEAQTSGSW